MKILWFTNTPCNASIILDPNMVIGGWLNSLEDEIIKQEEIELNICFYWKEDIKPLRNNNVNYYPVYISKKKRFIKRFNSTYNDINEVKSLLNVIDIVNPDLIHIHGTEYNFGLIQKYTKKKVIISLQGILSPYYEKYFSGIPKTTAIIYEKLSTKIKLNSEFNQYKRLKSSVNREKEILKISTDIIGRTDWDRRVGGILSPDSMYHRGNEILRKSFYENSWKKDKYSNTITLVTIMSGGLYKGLETIVKTLKILNSSSKQNFIWKIIGQNENDELAVIVKKWLKISYKEINLHFLGKLKEKELVNILLESDIYIQVSHIENSPNSVCEAMLLGMPIVASFAGGTSSILENNIEGILVQDGDSYSLAGTIIELSNNFEKAKLYGQNANKKALERHNHNKIGREYIEIYKKIIGK